MFRVSWVLRTTDVSTCCEFYSEAKAADWAEQIAKFGGRDVVVTEFHVLSKRKITHEPDWLEDCA